MLYWCSSASFPVSFLLVCLHLALTGNLQETTMWRVSESHPVLLWKWRDLISSLTKVFCHVNLLLERNFFSKKKFSDRTGNCTQLKNWSEALMEKCTLLPWKTNSEKNSFIPSQKFVHWKLIRKKFFSRIKEAVLVWSEWMKSIMTNGVQGDLVNECQSFLASRECADMCKKLEIMIIEMILLMQSIDECSA